MLGLVVAVALHVSVQELDMNERPVTKVVKLLEKMQMELEAEKESDQALYDKMACWCENTGAEKEAAIALATRQIEQLESDVASGSAKAAELEAAIEQLEKEIEENDQALRKADELRQKELAEFNEQDKQLSASIQALGNAITVLSKHQTFLQAGSLEGLKQTLAALKDSAGRVLDEHSYNVFKAFLEQPAGFKSYSSQSGAIFGVLQQMKETFEKDLKDATDEENQAASDFAGLKESKTAEMDAAKQQVKAKTEELADTSEALAQNKEDLKLTKAALKADTEFLADMKKRCARSDQEFEERSRTRQDEIVAVGQTIQILTSDEAFGLFGKTLPGKAASFVQVQSRTDRARLTRVAAVLRAAARKTGSEYLRAVSGLALSTKLDAFTKVKEAIDQMVAELEKQQEDQIAHKDFCNKELDENETNQAVKQDELDDLTTLVEESKVKISDLNNALAELNKQNKEMKVSMQRASEDREAENAEFQQLIAEQRGTQYILKKALDRMKEFYEPKQELTDQFGNAVAAVQTDQVPGAAVDAPPEGFDEYKKNEKSGGVLSLLQGLIDESKQAEDEALRAEADSQAAYEDFTKDGNKSIKTNNEEIAQKEAELAETTKTKTQAESDRSKALDDMEKLHQYAATLHASCDFTLKNFDRIQDARAAEMEALGQAKAILSGAQ